MSKLHIIGVGGTGHKVLSAAIHLTACGAFKGNLGPNEINGIRVLTIDADDSNGNLSQTKNTLSAYRSYYDALSGANRLGLVSIEPVSEAINISLYKADKKNINETFNIPQYAGSDVDKFIRFLYTDDEIKAEFDQGFYGHTSIGTLIVKDMLTSSKVWTEQLSQINADDFVFVIGSIFGGTGASAIPVLLDELNSKQKDTNFKLAALFLNPYFKTFGKIREKGTLQPDSANFHIKAKASLYYYYGQEQYKKANAFYIIGESETNFSNELASRGSSNQLNKASPIELFAATALIDFVKNSGKRRNSEIITASRSEKDGSLCWTWKMLQDSLPDLPENIQNTIKMAIFYNKVLYGQIKNSNAAGTWQGFYDNDINTKRDAKQNFVYENIHEYLKLLISWFYDIHKQNKPNINQNTGSLEWVADVRVKLFNANYENLFDDIPIQDGKIDNFEDLVYRDINGKKSPKIYAQICSEKPSDGNGKGFAALFDKLLDIVRKQERKFPLFGKNPPEPENFDSIPYLSRANNVTFKRPGGLNELWVESQPSLLEDIADGLPLNISKSFTKNDIAVPSPWSIFIMNELTLTEEKFEAINKAAFKEWCGIMALLALRKINRYENMGLKLELLELGGGDGGFLNVVNSTLTPGSFIFSDPNWIKCYRLSLDGVTIAFLANNTFVCPAYSIDKITKGKLNKIAPSIVNESGDFNSPDEYFKDQSQSLNRDAKYVLKLFLTELHTIITREAGRNRGKVIDSMQRLTGSYLEAVSSVTPNSNLAIEPEKKDSVHSVAALFEELCVEPSKANIELPFVMNGTKKQAALIGLNICGIGVHSAEAAHHLITENIVYNQIDQTNIDEYKNTTRDGIKLIYADELLNDSMIMIRKGGANDTVFYAMSNNSSLADYEIIWPLSEVLLELYDPKTLNKMISLSADSEKVTISLKIKLGKLNGKPVSHTVSKEYRIKNRNEMPDDDTQLNGLCSIMEKDKDYIPFWSVWPYAKVNDVEGNNTWRRYNYFCVELNYRGIPVLDIKPVFENGGNFLAGERKLSTLLTVTQEFYYRRYTSLPSAFRVNEKTEGAPVYRGLVILAEPKIVNAGAVRWNIGIDFGTTSTTSFYTTTVDGTPKFIQLMTEYEWREGDKEPIKSEYANDFVQLCDNGDKSSEYYFIDRQCFRQNGYATALEVMDTRSSSADATIFSGERIFWQNHKNFSVMNTQKGRKDRLLTNIKWDNNKSNSAKYLNQLLTQIVYHAAEKGSRDINFFFSYPTAFGPGAKDDFCGRIKSIIDNLSAETGIALNFNDKDNLVTESIAAAYYFNHKNPRQTMFFCIDIGGGSTDASIWVKTKHIFQTSIHFASRDMFIEPLKRLLYRPEVLKAVTNNDVSDGIYSMLSTEEKLYMDADKFKFLIETVLFEYYTPFINRLQDMKGRDEEAFKIFKYCVLIAYSGLIYYLTNIIASLFTIQDKERQIDNNTSQIIMGLSGKGSKLTTWIKSYCDIIYKEAENLIKEKTSLTIKIIPEFSPETAKTETAVGMICALDGDGRQKNKATIIKPDVYMGSGISVKKEKETRKLSAGDFVDVYNDHFFSSAKDIEMEFDKELSEFGLFIEFFNKITAQTSGDMPPIEINNYNKSKLTLWNKIKQEAANVLGVGRFEPPFILMLKVFLDEYAEEYLWKKLDQK